MAVNNFVKRSAFPSLGATPIKHVISVVGGIATHTIDYYHDRQIKSVTLQQRTINNDKLLPAWKYAALRGTK
jgi:hypothetical protein